mgnify:CR=1 FL=1
MQKSNETILTLVQYVGLLVTERDAKFSKKKPKPIESFNCDSVGNDPTEKYEDSSD